MCIGILSSRFVTAAARALPALLLLAAIGARPAGAETFPSRPVHLVVPFAAGGPSDTLARVLAGQLQARLGVAVVVENKPGGSGTIAIAHVARAAADGYTLLWGSDAVVVQPLLRKDFTIDTLRDLQPLAQVGSMPMLISVNARLPVRDLRQLVALASSSPGRLSYGSGGNGTILHITGELFKLASGAPLTHVPYKGTGPAVVDAAGGHIDVVITGTAEALPQIRAGNLRPLAYTSEKRNVALPEVPTVAQSGYPGFVAVGWMGVLAPAGVPQDVAGKLSYALLAAARSAEFQTAAQTEGMDHSVAGQAETREYLLAQRSRFKEVIEKTDIRAD